MGKGYKAETFGFFRTTESNCTRICSWVFNVLIWLQEKFNNKKGSIGLRFVEPFKKYKSFETELQGDETSIFTAIEILF